MSANKMPERIWLIPNAGNDGETVWCDNPAPGAGMDPADAVPYIRADLCASGQVRAAALTPAPPAQEAEPVIRRTGDLTDADYERALGILIQTQKASTALLQREIGLGYNAAAKLMERAEADGFVSTPNRVGKREVLVSAHPPHPGTSVAAAIAACETVLICAQEMCKAGHPVSAFNVATDALRALKGDADE